MKGEATPYLIIPRTDDEANYGKPTLLTIGEIDLILACLNDDEQYSRARALKEKLQALAAE